MGIITHRSLQEFDPNVAFGELFKQEHLMDIVAGQAVWGSYQYHREFNQSGMIP
jgi:hypothetical protein